MEPSGGGNPDLAGAASSPLGLEWEVEVRERLGHRSCTREKAEIDD